MFSYIYNKHETLCTLLVFWSNFVTSVSNGIQLSFDGRFFRYLVVCIMVGILDPVMLEKADEV